MPSDLKALLPAVSNISTTAVEICEVGVAFTLLVYGVESHG